MIKSITLKNFKGHENSTVNFGPVTTFIGASDEGKSTIGFKALKIALTGQNWNPGWLRHGTEKGSIEIELDDGTKVLRTRTLAGQSTKLTDKDGKIEKFAGQKDSVSFLLALTGVKKVELDSQEGPEDLNFIRNGQKAFLIENDPEVIQRKVVGILRCNEIESAKIRLNKRLNQKKEEQRYLAEEDSRLVRRLESLVAVREKVHKVDDALDDAIDRHQQTHYNIELLGELKELTHLYRYTVEKVRLAGELYESGLKTQQISRQVSTLAEQRINEQMIVVNIGRVNALKGLTLLAELQQLESEKQDLQDLREQACEEITGLMIGSAEALLDQGRCPVCGTKLSVI